MKKIVTKIFLLGLLTVSSLNAKELFDLKAQDFEHTLTDKYINAKYKVDENIVVETNLGKGSRGFYFFEGDPFGYFSINLNKPIDKFTINFDLIYETRYGSERLQC